MNTKVKFLGLGIVTILGVLAGAGWYAQQPDMPNPNLVTVYKTPTCGCCSKWVDHLRDSGFEVDVKNRESLVSVRAQYGVPDKLASCHTAHIGGYAVEGHVPATDIRRLLSQRPVAAGISVPGMTAGSPGMEVEGRSDPYQVILFGPEKNSVYAVYP